MDNNVDGGDDQTHWQKNLMDLQCPPGGGEKYGTEGQEKNEGDAAERQMIGWETEIGAPVQGKAAKIMDGT